MDHQLGGLTLSGLDMINCMAEVVRINRSEEDDSNGI